MNSFHRLPINTRIWLWFEQTHNPKIYDKDFFPKPDDIKLAQRYLPESRNILNLAAYIIPKNSLTGLSINNSRFLDLIREGDNHILLLVHPNLQNEQLFNQFGFEKSRRTFFFMPAASAKTGLTWELGKEHTPFFTKMSMAKESENSTGTVKSDLGKEGYVSVAKTSIFDFSCKDLINNFFQDQLTIELSPQFKSFLKTSYGYSLGRYQTKLLIVILSMPHFLLYHTPI